MRNNLLINLITGLVLASGTISAISPEDSLKYANWHNKDAEINKIWGVSTDKAYNEFLNKKESKSVIVAVIDGGVDIEHEDIRENIWVNEDEIPENGIDDDNNGYIDDINGWNFLGNANGENLNDAQLEVTRLYRLFKDKYDSIALDSLKKSDSLAYDYYKKVVNTFYIESSQIELENGFFEGITENFNKYDSLLQVKLDKEKYTLSDLKEFKPSRRSLADIAKRYMIWLAKLGFGKSDIAEQKEFFYKRLNYHFNPEFNSRTIIGDDETIWDSNYGNNDVTGPDPSHGTMVSGLIAATRNNGIGINGVASNVKIMVLRAVPDGDEWDKDVANAIKYAIDNGANIINMSFGKDFSPQKEFVDSIVRLASRNDVLLVHAAGNDGKNIDVKTNYPQKISATGEILTKNWLTIGATAIKRSKKEFVADFSNYGIKSVDIFAPGQDILTCAPNNAYDIASGTSFAAPIVSGVAALLKAYYPQFSASQIKNIILTSSSTEDVKVVLPGTGGYRKKKEIVKFSSLSNTGGIINVYQAVQLAESIH